MKKYCIYHIKGKKWGCTVNLRKRLKKQGYTLDDVCEVIEVYDEIEASDLEKELNLKYGYPYNDTQYYARCRKLFNKASTISVSQNLGIMTKDENKRREWAVLGGLSQRGEAHPSAKMTEKIAISILKDYKNKKSKYKIYVRLAEKYNVTVNQVRHLVNGETWKHLPR